MKKALKSLPLKITAVLTSYVMTIVLILSVLSVAFMGYEGFYFKSKDRIYDEILGAMAMNEAYKLSEMGITEDTVDKNGRYSNYYYEITDISGETVTGYFLGNADILLSREYNDGSYIYTVYIPKDMKNNDELAFVKKLIDTGYSLKYYLIAFAVLSLVSVIILFCYICCAAGHKKDYNGIYLGYLDLVPTDVYLIILTVLSAIFGAFITEFYFEGLELVFYIFALGTLLYFLAIGFMITLAKRVKTKTVFKNTLIYKLSALIIKGVKAFGRFVIYYFKKLPLAWKTLLILTVLLFIEAVYMLLTADYYNVVTYVLAFIFDVVISIVVMYIAVTLQIIKKGGDKIASGDITHKIDTRYMVLDFKEFSENLNGIGKGLEAAVNEKMKSEMFKTELITNVSHDIKTPLTSIINYVDLLKKEEIENDTAREYILTLERQSDRLKKLIEDLVEASKAATGNLAVNLAPCDIGVLLSQSIGEFDERFNNANVTPLLKKPEESVIIKADARHLWRVIDNLLNNICKYSQPETRAYIDVKAVNNKAVITLKNVSRYELNISPDELMERFVRGDKSRNTEGGGLGLSIAKSLTELQQGKMSIEVDGDLFKVTLEFDIVK